MERNRSKKFKHKQNIPWAKVGRRVFRSLVDAEVYCTKNKLDVDEVIEYAEQRDNPELYKTVQEMAKIQKVILREVLSRLDENFEHLKAKKELAVKEWQVAKDSRDILTDHYANQIDKYIGMIEENGDCRKIVWNLLEELERVTGWHD